MECRHGLIVYLNRMSILHQTSRMFRKLLWLILIYWFVCVLNVGRMYGIEIDIHQSNNNDKIKHAAFLLWKILRAHHYPAKYNFIERLFISQHGTSNYVATLVRRTAGPAGWRPGSQHRDGCRENKNILTEKIKIY